MSGNYDVTAVTVRGSVDNTNSFNKVGDKYQFKGTSWNQTAHIVNDKNDGVIFEEGKDMTLQLNTRYKNGLPETYANMDKKHTGISFDLLDKFIKASADGILVDVDHDGYTPENMRNFGKAFDALRQRKLAEAKNDPYNKKYTKMMSGTEFTFTASELQELYEAAGFALAKKDDQAVKKEDDAPKNTTTTTTTTSVPASTGDDSVPEGSFTVGTDDDVKSKFQEELLNKIVEALGIQDKEKFVIEFGAEAIDDDGNITEALYFTYEGEQYLIQQGNIKDLQIVKQEMPENPEYDKKPANGEAAKKVETRYNVKTGRLQERKAGTFLGLFHTHKWHDVVDPETGEAHGIPRAAAKRNQQVAQPAAAQPAAAQQPAQKTQEEKLADYYKKEVTDAKFWSGRIAVERNVDDPESFSGSYDQVTTTDGRRLARVSNYVDHKQTYKYYEVKATEIHSEYGENRKYFQIVPDLTKEVVDAKF